MIFVCLVILNFHRKYIYDRIYLLVFIKTYVFFKPSIIRKLDTYSITYLFHKYCKFQHYYQPIIVHCLTKAISRSEQQLFYSQVFRIHFLQVTFLFNLLTSTDYYEIVIVGRAQNICSLANLFFLITQSLLVNLVKQKLLLSSHNKK